MVVIIKNRDCQAASQIMQKYGSRLIYNTIQSNGEIFCIINQGNMAGLIEIDMKYGYDYKEGRIVKRC